MEIKYRNYNKYKLKYIDTQQYADLGVINEHDCCYCIKLYINCEKL